MTDAANLDEIKEMRTGDDPDLTVRSIAKMLVIWNRLAAKWESWLFVCGFTAVASSLFIAGFAQQKYMTAYDALPLKILGFISALSLTVITTFNMSKKASNVLKAWRHLNKAYYRYQAGIITIKDLIQAYDESEEMIGDSIDFNYVKKPT
jgi:hypothetical protein